jgi:hypothetical protein
VFPNLIWLGLPQVFFGFFQFLGHGIIMNVKGRKLYNPGLAAVIFLHVPIGIYYIRYVTQHGLVTRMDYIWGFAALPVAIVLIVPCRSNFEGPEHALRFEPGEGFPVQRHREAEGQRPVVILSRPAA